jgi:hypothetical protein
MCHAQLEGYRFWKGKKLSKKFRGIFLNLVDNFVHEMATLSIGRQLRADNACQYMLYVLKLLTI